MTLAFPVREIECQWIEMPDGRRLAARLWLPEGAGPVPAILEYLPYRRRDGTAPRDATTHPVFAAEGFACIRVDISGSGDSDGLFDDEYSEREMQDGEAVLAWIAGQDWCDGNVGMIGISWGGFNGLQLAARRPAALKAIVTVCSSVDRFSDDIHFMGGCLLTDNFNWGAQMTAYMTRPPDPAMRDDWREQWLARMENLPFMAADWLRHPARDAFWRYNSVCEDFSRIEAATLAIGGWADAYVNAPFALSENLDAPVAALLGPWEHKYPHISRILPADFHGEVLRWFGHYLAGKDTGADAVPRLRAFMQEATDPSPLYGPRKGEWVAADAAPSDAVDFREMRIAGGALGEAAGTGEAEVSTSLLVGRGAAYFCPGMRIDNELASDQADDDALSTCFDTEPLSGDLDLLGRPVVEFAFSVDKPVAQLCFRLCDVAPDGRSWRISYRPFNLCTVDGYDAPRELEPGRTYRARVELNACGHRLRAGHRLRLAVSTSYWPVVWPAAEAAAVTLTEADFTLTLPVRKEAGAAADAPGAPRDFPVIDGEQLRGTDSRTKRFREDDGTFVLDTFDDFGLFRQAADGLEIGNTVGQRFSIHEDDPTTARHETSWTYELGRRDWRIRIGSRSVMTCGPDNFHLSVEVEAYEGDERVFSRNWQEAIPRGHL